MEDRLLAYARQMRRDPTEAEALLWRRLRAHRFAGFKFRRQQPIGPYIADFVCHAKQLVIEVDGGQHGDAKSYDATRTARLESQGFRVIRFWNHDVLQRTDTVLDAVWAALQSD